MTQLERLQAENLRLFSQLEMAKEENKKLKNVLEDIKSVVEEIKTKKFWMWLLKSVIGLLIQKVSEIIEEQEKQNQNS